jgi:putative NADH-flavin reductase
MNIVLYGATGQAGSRILKEALSRGHHVTAITRDPKKLASATGLTVKQDDLSDIDKIAATIKGADAVVSAYAPPADKPDEIVGVTQRLVAAVKKAGVPRLIVVGGAGGLEIAPGVTLIDSGYLPAEWLAIANSHVKALEVLKSSEIDWTYFAPAAYFVPGERTGKFRLGKDMLISDEKHDSRISLEDYAIALVDELEKPAHRKQRFTIGY